MLAYQRCHMQLSGKQVTLCYDDKFLISCNLHSRSTSNARFSLGYGHVTHSYLTVHRESSHLAAELPQLSPDASMSLAAK